MRRDVAPPERFARLRVTCLSLAAALALAPTAAAETRADQPAAEASPAAAPAPTVTPAPAAPAPTPAAATTVAPVRPRRVTLGDHGAIELGQPRAASDRWKGFPISLSLRDAPLPEVLRSFARLVGVNLVLHPGVQGEVTIELVDVPWDQALHVILRAHGMGAELDGRAWVVRPR
jgi:hypothetical protein